MIKLPATGPDAEVWEVVCDLSNDFGGRWCLIGARMVELHGLARDRQPPRRSADVDALCDAKALGSHPRDVVAWLQVRDFRSDGVSPEGIGHRYRRDAVFVDVLAPDHLGARADLTVEPGIRTVPVPGGRRALGLVVRLAVRCGAVEADVPVPSVAGALILKSAAVEVDDVPEDQRVDVAFLYSIVNDVAGVRDELGSAGRKLLRRRAELRDRQHRAWRELGDHAQDGYDAYRFLTE